MAMFGFASEAHATNEQERRCLIDRTTRGWPAPLPCGRPPESGGQGPFLPDVGKRSQRARHGLPRRSSAGPLALTTAWLGRLLEGGPLARCARRRNPATPSRRRHPSTPYDVRSGSAETRGQPAASDLKSRSDKTTVKAKGNFGDAGSGRVGQRLLEVLRPKGGVPQFAQRVGGAGS